MCTSPWFPLFYWLFKFKTTNGFKGQMNQKNWHFFFLRFTFTRQIIKWSILSKIWAKIFVPSLYRDFKDQNPSSSEGEIKHAGEQGRQGISTSRFRRLPNEQNDWYNVLGNSEQYQFEPPVLEEKSYASNDSFDGLKREGMIQFLHKWLLWKR